MGVVPAGCDHAEARFVEQRSELVAVRNGLVEHVDTYVSAGLGVRARVAGAWGFAATDRVTASGARQALARAIAIAAAQPRPAGAGGAWAAGLAPEPPARGHWESPAERDPFSVSLDDKIALLLAADAALAGDPRIARRDAECLSVVTRKAFASTEGAACTQTATACGGGVRALAVEGDEAQTRSYPSNHGGSVAQAGWEHLLALDLPGEAPRVAEEAVALLTAPVCPAGETTVVIGAEQLALQIHESIGHALELDRILGGELSYAGGSWVGAGDLGSLRYGSELLEIVADGTAPGGLGTFGWDDEGVAAQRAPLVSGGVLRAALSDRTTA